MDFKRYRKIIEKLFSQMNDLLMMIRNYAMHPRLLHKDGYQSCCFHEVQSFNHKPIRQDKCALI
ncbi:MAG: hypothetical protein J5918_05895 [Prevotella sp.]|nr:hypothetical protein [Prevotella sp.]